MTIVAQERIQRVQILPDDLVNQIAAGEVVERPASVVKELVENAIDAGATRIDVILEVGGKSLIEISDDGCGMSERDARTAIERHATSKIARFDDLLAVSTLGFRGEALPSIASVSRFSIVTWDGVEPHATEVLCEGGPPVIRPAARDRGTTVRVADLFESVPARRKFLKSTDTEFRSAVAVITSYALPAPHRAFRLTHNGRVVLDLPAASTHRERAVQILGNDVEDFLVEIDHTIDRVTARGFVTRGLRYGSRRNQFFFVNGRLVRDRVLTHAANRATDSFDFDGHPAVVLFLELDPQLVDVNVHPAKTEVRFRDSGAVHVAVEHGIRNALAGPEEGRKLLASSAPDRVADEPRVVVDLPELRGAWARQENFSIAPPAPSYREPQFDATPLFQQRPVVQPPRAEPAPAPALGDLKGRVIGQYRDSYILVDTPEGLRLVDQHVAHERVLHDRIEERRSEAVASQKLLTPFLYEAGAAERGALESHLSELREVGFEIEPFSGNTMAISAVPTLLANRDLHRFFRKLLDMASDGKTSHLSGLRAKLIATIACHAAIKVHRPLSGAEMSQLMGDLLTTTNPFACPHGRPIIVDIRHLDIEKHFHRK